MHIWAANLPVGLSTIVPAQADFANGPMDVTQQATYIARSGGTSVFSVGTGGSITTTGAGVDWLDVSYGGVTTSAQIAVGSCSYVLTPTNQYVGVSGGMVSIQVTTATGCAWTADRGNSTWLSLTNSSGNASGVITATATPNATGATQTAIVTVAGQDVAITQPATSCTYALKPTQIDAPATGASGSISVTTSCPIVASSSANWITVVPLSSSVNYNIAANTNSSPQSATITIGNQTVNVTEAGAPLGPLVTLNPSSVAVPVNGSVSFSAAASGNPTPTVQWQVSINGGTTFTNISGAIATTLMFTATASQNGNQYRAVFTNAAGTATTRAATLTVDQAPAITSANHTTFTIGVPGSFKVTATGLPAPTITTGGPLPGGVTLSSSGLLSGTPAPETSGVYPFTITASNGALPNATQSFKLTVLKAAATKCSITSSMLYFSTGQPVSFTADVKTGSGEIETPTGTVSFVDSADSQVVLGKVPLVDGVAKITVVLQPLPSQWIKADYSGDNEFAPCQSAYIPEYNRR